MISPRDISLGHLTWSGDASGGELVRKISPATWTILGRALVPPPCAYGRLPWTFLFVRDPQVRATLLSFSPGQVPLFDGSHFVVFARNTTMSDAEVENFIQRSTNGHTAQHGAFRVYPVAKIGERGHGMRSISVREWTERQARIAQCDLLVSANLLGVDACPMTDLDPARYDEVLGLTAKGYSTVCACALGYSDTGVPASSDGTEHSQSRTGNPVY